MRDNQTTIHIIFKYCSVIVCVPALIIDGLLKVLLLKACCLRNVIETDLRLIKSIIIYINLINYL
jgi:hypothetical protein